MRAVILVHRWVQGVRPAFGDPVLWCISGFETVFRDPYVGVDWKQPATRNVFVLPSSEWLSSMDWAVECWWFSDWLGRYRCVEMHSESVERLSTKCRPEFCPWKNSLGSIEVRLLLVYDDNWDMVVSRVRVAWALRMHSVVRLLNYFFFVYIAREKNRLNVKFHRLKITVIIRDKWRLHAFQSS